MAKRAVAVWQICQHLASFEGATWQQRWAASDLNVDAGRLSAMNPSTRSWSMAVGFKVLAASRLIVPSVQALRVLGLPDYSVLFLAMQREPGIDEVVERITCAPASREHRQSAVTALCYALTAHGIPLADLTPEGLLHWALAHQAARTESKSYDSLPGVLLWQVLSEMGHFPVGTPRGLRTALSGGRKTVTELVDSYGVDSAALRQLFIDYLSHRSVEGMDYASLCGFARNLVRNFWCVIQRINPQQADLAIDSATYEAWRASIDTVQTPHGPQERRAIWEILLAVRAFYLDIQSWSAEDPARWGPWVARCPVPQVKGQAYARSRRRMSERVADRTRLRQPLLPVLTEFVTEQREYFRDLERAAVAVPMGVEFAVRGERYTRLDVPDRPKMGRSIRPSVEVTPVQVRSHATGEVLFPAARHEKAFWRWAIVQVLQLTGLRQEEMLELSHLSVRQYLRPNGEVIALLVVAPSKSDRERVIPMTADLFHVIAELIRFQSIDGAPIPLIRRWDPYEREHSPPLPYLFQHQTGPTRSVYSPAWALSVLREVCLDVGVQHPEFAGVKFAPHDFRRIFATELVNTGLPIHIGAALLGHTNIQTTRGYVAVFEEDVIEHYQQHLAKRRTTRPVEEYRPATGTEWAEFETHFEKRKVELGGCARPYGTPCTHEHACVRCPMLQINPNMLPRLIELEDDLVARRSRAQSEGWLGEIDGIDLTLTFLRSKRADAVRHLRNGRQPAGLMQIGFGVTRSSPAR